jgi:serine/threonine protein kinase
LREADSRVLSLIYEEFCLGEERGDGIDVESFCNRYPEWKDSLVSQLQYHRLFSQAAGLGPAAPTFPDPGEKFEEFDLIALLGKGGTSRVFLARDLSLGGKQVVLKVSLDRGPEPHAQGALEHPHIVPVNSVVFGDRQLRGLSMPFRPGLPLDELIKRVNPAARPRRALDLWNALVAGLAERPSPLAPEATAALPSDDDPQGGPRGDGWKGFPVRGTYAQGVAWFGMMLARTLDYAHSMRTFHRDVKPANVLLTLHHGPQLLDFNLADSPHSTRQAKAAIHGGTLPYMAPEQIEAFLNPDLWDKVGAQADIYSLGLVLRELLTGQAPDLPAEKLSPPRALRLMLDRRPLLDVSVRRSNSAIPHALEVIVAKCLAIAPADRYPSGHALAVDFDRFLKHQRLAYATNPSHRERIGNSVRRAHDRVTRHPRMLAAAAACLLLSGLLLAAAGLFRPAINRFKTPLPLERSFQSAVENIEQGEFDQAARRLRKLSWWYPESALFKVYLSFALDGTRHSAKAKPGAKPSDEAEDSLNRAVEAESHFREALDDPNLGNQLMDWVRHHPKVVRHLEEFGETRFLRANWLAERNPTDKDPYANAEQTKEEQKRLRELGQRAFLLAKELNSNSTQASRPAAEVGPGAMKASRLIAIAEEGEANYQSAYERLSRSIDSAKPGQAIVERDVRKQLDELAKQALPLAAELNPGLVKVAVLLALADEAAGDFPSAPGRITPLVDSAKVAYERLSRLVGSVMEVKEFERELFSSRTVRARIATKWAGQLRSRSGAGALQHACDLMHGAVEDLDHCEQYMAARHNRNPVITFYVLCNKLPALLTLGEIEIDLGLTREAAGHLGGARRTIDQLTGLTKNSALVLPKDVPLWSERVQDALRRLGRDEVSPAVTPDRSPHG